MPRQYFGTPGHDLLAQQPPVYQRRIPDKKRPIPGMVQRKVCFEGGDQHAAAWKQRDH
jgi:hypothetical protein